MFVIRNKRIAVALFLGLLVVGLGVYVYTREAKTVEPKAEATEVPPQGVIHVEGTIVCLPHKDAEGPQTLECAYGIRDAGGRYFGLADSDPQYKNISGLATDAYVRVEGTFTPRADSKYVDIGIIVVEKVAVATAPARGQLSGVYTCLVQTGVQWKEGDECVPGILTDDKKKFALDFNLLSQAPPKIAVGQRFSAQGVITPIEALSTNRWETYELEGIFSVTDSILPQ